MAASSIRTTLQSASILGDQIYNFIQKRQGVSCVELYREFGEGDHSICAGHDSNIIIAFGLSQALSHALIKLLAHAEIVPIPAHILIYLADGGWPPLPIAQRPPRRGYKKPHWQPVAFDTYDFGVMEYKKIVKNKEDLKIVLANLAQKRATEAI